MNGISLVPVAGRALLDRFIRLPERLHRDDPHYIAPLHLERRDALTPKNPFFANAEVQFWIAVKDGRDVGRISAQIDHQALAVRADATGLFGMLAAEDDPAVFRALFTQAEEWLKARGMRRMLGPFNLNINEQMGLLVAGFESPPMLMMEHDRPYVGARLEERGLAREKDVFAYLYDISSEFPPSVRRLLERPLPASLTVRSMDIKRYDEEIRSITEIFNDAWRDNWGFVPLTEVETAHLAKSLKDILDPRIASVVEQNGQPVGFIVALPNLNEAIRDLGGKLLPFGWVKLLWRLKVAGLKTARVPLMGIKRSAAQAGLTRGLMSYLLIDTVRRELIALGYTHVELSWILEDNRPMRRIIESLGAVAYKTYRIYGKSL